MTLDFKQKIKLACYTGGRILLGGVFVYASWEKIVDPADFANVIANYQILPATWVNPTALLLPWLELVCGLCLIVNRWTNGGALTAAVLMAIFISALGYNAYRGMDVNCGCFALSDETPASMWYYLARDAVLLAMAIGLIIGGRTNAIQTNPSQVRNHVQ